MEPTENQDVINQQQQTEQVAEPAQENVEEIKTSTENQPEGAATEVKPKEGIERPKENEEPLKDQPEVSDEIQKKLDRLREYEVKENEVNELRNRLGVKPEVDNLVFNAQRQMNIIENQVQQEYIRLCNEYGVDYRADKIDASANELLEKDPKAFYDLKYKLTELTNGLNAKREEVNNFIYNRNLTLARERNKQVFETSPAIAEVVDTLVRNGNIDVDMIDDVVAYGIKIAKEAYEMGKMFATSQEAKKSPAEILNNNVITQQGATSLPNNQLTLEDVQKMDLKTYAKNAALIDKLYAEGRLK